LKFISLTFAKLALGAAGSGSSSSSSSESSPFCCFLARVAGFAAEGVTGAATGTGSARPFVPADKGVAVALRDSLTLLSAAASDCLKVVAVIYSVSVFNLASVFSCASRAFLASAAFMAAMVAA
jgi:hypothetical protein